MTTGSPQVGRHRARRNAMMVLYKLDLMPRAVEEAIADWEREHTFSLPDYARELVVGVSQEREQLDATISERLEEWTLDRLGAIERAILRIATFEMQHEIVPRPVAIDEAVELAKRYASPEAAKLVNGVLGATGRSARQDHAAPLPQEDDA